MSLYSRAATGAASTDNEVVKPALSQAVGYVVVVVIGLIIATKTLRGPSVMIFVTKLLKRTVGEDNKKTEM
ncbi:MAG: hypothetical protein L6R41_003098 [Letrouitia leprolyta]|nr:MAG: hypothetical protein L6R41_003098 [Letrouitia leprolyta]